jgi:hypothetical protein
MTSLNSECAIRDGAAGATAEVAVEIAAVRQIPDAATEAVEVDDGDADDDTAHAFDRDST